MLPLAFSLASLRVEHSCAPKQAGLGVSAGILFCCDSGSVAFLLLAGTVPWAEGRRRAGRTAGGSDGWQTMGRLCPSDETGQGEECGATPAMAHEDTGVDSGEQSADQRR